MKTSAWCLILFFTVSCLAHADYVPSQSKAPEPVREFRGAWVATVHNIDWPSKTGLSASEQKKEMIELLDSAASVGINAIVLQVRTEFDALYKSTYEPWSHWLTGNQGQDPGYDPLQFAVEESHKRGMELHAWFNPFRASATESSPKKSNHITKTHSNLMLRAGTQVWADPSSDYIRQRAITVMTDVLRRYDVDGIHMDDYFYPYPKNINGTMKDQFDDSKAFQAFKNKGGRLSVRDWRRSNIDGFINQLYSSIKSIRPYVKFGISPFGIWRPGVPDNIEASLDSFDHLAADSRKWLREGWVDYLSPQLYWRIDDAPHSFSALSRWWAGENVRGRHLWPGVASSRILSSEDKGRPASESIKQIELTRTVTAKSFGSGHIHWNYSALGNDQGGIRKQLGRIYSETAIIPPSSWLGAQTPTELWVAAKNEGNAVVLYFRSTPDARWRLVQVRETPNSPWITLRMLPASQPALKLNATPYEIALRNISATGVLSEQTVVRRK